MNKQAGFLFFSKEWLLNIRHLRQRWEGKKYPYQERDISRFTHLGCLVSEKCTLTISHETETLLVTSSVVLGKLFLTLGEHCVWLSLVWLFGTPQTVAHRAPLPMEFSRQEYWHGLPFSSPGDLPDLGIKPTSLASPTLAGIFFWPLAPPGKPVGRHGFLKWLIQIIFKFLIRWIIYEIVWLKEACVGLIVD